MARAFLLDNKGIKLTARAYERGWPIVFQNEDWVYDDTGKPAVDDRPCPRCGEMPTPKGHDACLGTLPNVKAACCGHGVSKPYILGLPER